MWIKKKKKNTNRFGRREVLFFIIKLNNKLLKYVFVDAHSGL